MGTYNRQQPAYKRQGFSLVEILIAVMVSSITMYAIGTFMYRFFQNNEKLRAKIDKSAEKRVASKYFIDFAQLAGASSQYMHLPTKICSQSEAANHLLPCIRWLRDDMKFTNYIPSSKVQGLFSPLPSGVTFTNSSLVTNQHMEFFRDDYGSPTIKNQGTTSKILVGAQIALTNMLAASPIYSTWVLQDETSKPFLSLAYKKTGAEYLTFENLLSENTPNICSGISMSAVNQPFADAGGYLLGTLPNYSATMNLSAWIGSLVVVYSSSDPSHYFFQVIKNIVKCNWGASPASQCTDAWAAYDYNGTPTQPNNTTKYNVVIQLDAVPNFNSGFPPSPATAYTEVTSPSDFTNQSAGSSLFPTQVTAFYDVDNGGARIPFFGPATGGANFPTAGALTLSAHTFRGCSGDASPFMMIPVDLKAFYILKSGTGNCGSQTATCSLNIATYNWTTGSIVVSPMITKLEGSVIIGRKLGGLSLNLFTYLGFTQADWFF